MQRRFWAIAGTAGALAVLAVLLASSPAPLPALSEPIPEWPHASPPADMSIAHLPTGIVHRNAAFAYRGGSFRDKREFAVSAVLVRHPRGDLLIDTGFSRDIDAKFERMPFWFRAVTDYTMLEPAAAQLDRAGYDRHRLRAIVLTHAHWDHASAMGEFPDTPVWVGARERKFIADNSFAARVARSIQGVRYETYTFNKGPFLGFPASHDVYGDGSVVIVPAPGHTPGSVILFVSLPDGKRYAFVGDLAWQQEGIRLREERPWFTRLPADEDPNAVRETLRRMSAIAERYPDLILVPAHDLRAYASIPRFGR
jgi:N-acyl homoserine lactone hydrolase